MTGLTALLLFAAWTLLVMSIYVFPRVALVLANKYKANTWTRGQATPDGPLLVRAQHAHMNCVENLPVFAALVLAAQALGQSAVVDGMLAAVFLYARVAQGVVHLISTSHLMVLLRAVLFVIQLGVYLLILKGLLA
ncbi:MAG TPA: MAPEG family protein [Nevskiaceae bacterium]|nr:MAPEG family protein [Nevskiaceae bacterium]